MSQRFSASTEVLADLLPQSVLGRAQQGHGHFVDEFGLSLRFPDATFESVLSVLERDNSSMRADLVRGRRGNMLANFSEWVMDNIDQPELTLAIDGKPIFGVGFLAEKPVETRAFLTGLVLAGFMDDWSYREATMFQFKRCFNGDPFHIGGGDILIVDREKFAQSGLGDTGRVHFGKDQLRELEDVGVICQNRHGDYSWPQYDQAYFRRCMGEGVCDDLALIAIGAHHGYDAMLGGFVMDAIDTYDKYLLSLVWGGFDTSLAGRIQRHFTDKEGQPLVDDRLILDLIHFAAKRNDPRVGLSSSHRRLIQIEPRAKVPTLLNHWRFLQGQRLYHIKLGFARVPADEFYPLAARRLDHAGLGVKAPVFFGVRPDDS
ncbi:MAG: hypothetical protein ACI9UK_000716 [Candidatus Krumholzibacteriia bacterium]|jgi:hypothetical protein